MGLKESRVSLFIQNILIANFFVTHWGGRGPGASKPFFGKGMAKIMTKFMAKVMAKGQAMAETMAKQWGKQTYYRLAKDSLINGLIHS